MDSINVDVKLIWIPSHLAIAGNEIVDQLAQSALYNGAVSTKLYVGHRWQHELVSSSWAIVTGYTTTSRIN